MADIPSIFLEKKCKLCKSLQLIKSCRELMWKNVNNDFSKDSPIGLIEQ